MKIEKLNKLKEIVIRILGKEDNYFASKNTDSERIQLLISDKWNEYYGYKKSPLSPEDKDFLENIYQKLKAKEEKERNRLENPFLITTDYDKEYYLDSFSRLEEEKAIISLNNNEGNIIISRDMLINNVKETWLDFKNHCPKNYKIDYKIFLDVARTAKSNYKEEVEDHHRNNAHSYAKYWAGFMGKSYSHYRREYGI